MVRPLNVIIFFNAYSPNTYSSFSILITLLIHMPLYIIFNYLHLFKAYNELLEQLCRDC